MVKNKKQTYSKVCEKYGSIINARLTNQYSRSLTLRLIFSYGRAARARTAS